MQKIKVLIWSEFPPKTKTGISLINQLVLNCLKSKGQNVSILEECAWNKGKAGTIFHHFSNYIKLLLLLLKNSVSYLYFTFPLSKGGVLKLIFIFPFIKICSRKTRLVGHIHRGDFNIFSKESVINRMLLNTCFCFLDKVVVLSEMFKTDVSEFSPKSDIFVLRNTSPIEQDGNRSQKVYQKKFICVSNYISSKGLMELVQVFKLDHFRDLNLNIHGSAFDNELIKELKLQKSQNVQINGPLAREELMDEMSKFDCLIVPSRNEGQPIVILEAMSLGLPVIAYKVGDIENMLGSDYPFLTNPVNNINLSEKIQLFDHFTNKEKLSLDLTERYKKYYSNSVFCENITQLFKDL